jgi:hypothetical protein
MQSTGSHAVITSVALHPAINVMTDHWHILPTLSLFIRYYRHYICSLRDSRAGSVGLGEHTISDIRTIELNRERCILNNESIDIGSWTCRNISSEYVERRRTYRYVLVCELLGTTTHTGNLCNENSRAHHAYDAS